MINIKTQLDSLKNTVFVKKKVKPAVKSVVKIVRRDPRWRFFSTKQAHAQASRRPFAGDKHQQRISEIQDKLNQHLFVYEDVVSYPLTEGTKKEYAGGLVNSKTGLLIEEAVHFRGVYCQELPRIELARLSTDNIPEIKHTVLFAGILFNNFGHFLLESLGRLWAYNYVREMEPYILFYSDQREPGYLEKNNFMNQVLTGLKIPHEKILILNYPVRIKQVLIPLQKYGYEYCRKPDAYFLNFVKEFKFPGIVPKDFDNADKVYVSRSRIRYGNGKCIGEALFEEFLKLEGYRIFFPEKYDLIHQLAVYDNARKLIFNDGGALHGCILLPNLKAEVAVISRRKDAVWDCSEILDQFKGYGQQVTWIDAITKQYQFGLHSWNALAVIDWHEVSIELKREGYVEKIYDSMNEEAEQDLIRTELHHHVQAIADNPGFVDFMLKQSEKF